ncbi:MAG: metallophosphoesterase family protein [Anaerolineae bacterium]|nr:metallophosphoesterase family protein [Anaerolineae bacterium]
MVTLTRRLSLWNVPRTRTRQCIHALQQALAHRRLDMVFQAAPTVPFDNASRLVFFSDAHRGDNSRTDAFRVNEPLFLHALRHYFDQGFTYIEVGDGDELWKNRRFDTVQKAHAQVFALFHRFAETQRLHLLFGNHDIIGNRRQPVNKGGLIAHEGLILQQRHNGQQIFVTHGHQADAKADLFYQISRMAVRNVWRRLQLMHLAPVSCRDGEEKTPRSYEQFLTRWAADRQRILVCGHTHRPASAVYGEAPYFNTGYCLAPGILTGLEIQHGEIGLVRWRATPHSTTPFQREILSAPRRLKYFW